MSPDLIAKVVVVRGHCPVSAVGNRFETADGFYLRADCALCRHTLMALALHYVALNGVSRPPT